MQVIDLINEVVASRYNAEYDRLDTPHSLATAMIIECAELLENYKFVYSNDTQNIKDEIADVFIYLAALVDRYNFDLEEIVLEKMKRWKL